MKRIAKQKKRKEKNVSDIVKGYKVFESNWVCRGKKYSCPGRFKEEGELEICWHGMHFCRNLIDCFDYYDFNPGNHVAEVIAHGNVIGSTDKCCTDDLEIIREIQWGEVLQIVNAGKDCTGFSNTGDYNEGNYNAGRYNTGHQNTGDYNTGSRNTGDSNKGSNNTGEENVGDCNTGEYNAGNCNAGDHNAGNYNTGDQNAGSCNDGNYNTGNYNTGNYNTGRRNTGSYNTGNYNAGSCNTGNRNTGNCNAGNYNTGNHNTGSHNAGRRNTGDYNKSSCNTGCFMTEEHTICLFNKPSNWSFWDWTKSDAKKLLNQIPKNVVEWVMWEEMTDKEMEENPTYEITGGYLKELDESECGQIWWDGLTDEEKRIIKAIPNYDKEIFEEITGIKTE